MSATLMTAPAAGWYRDPADSGAWRWWDGASWTEHLRAVETPTQTGPVQVEPPQSAPVPSTPVPPQPAPVAPEQIVIEPVPTHAPVFEQVAPVAPAAPDAAPAAAAAPPAPAAASAIPEPGQTAPPPPARPSNVSLTPAIPVTDQMYWHSAAAEKIEVPRLTHTDSIRTQRATTSPAFVRDWNDLGSPHTVGVWLLALSPVISLGVGSLLGIVDGLSGGVFGRYLILVSAAVAIGLNWVFAYADQRQLRERGYHPAPIGWMLLFPPIAYLIARGKAVRREGMSAWPPELVFVLAFVAIAAINVVTRLGVLNLGAGG